MTSRSPKEKALKPGTIVKPTVAYARFMRQHGCRAPYDGVVLSTSQDFVRVVWNNADGHAMQMRHDALKATNQMLSEAQTKALEAEANAKDF